MREIGRYAFLYVCDGHGGPNLAKKLGECFDGIVTVELKKLAPDATPEAMVEFYRQCYWKAVQGAESERGGTTFTAGLLQLDTMIYCSLQLGDSLVGALDPVRGTLFESEVTPPPHGVER